MFSLCQKLNEKFFLSSNQREMRAIVYYNPKNKGKKCVFNFILFEIIKLMR